MLTRRLQVLIDPEQYDRLRREAQSRGVAVGEVVREAIDRALAPHEERRRKAFDQLMAVEPIPVPDDPRDLETEIAGALES